MLTPRKRSLATTCIAFLFVACLLLCGTASAAPSISLSKKSGPPTSKILVSGRGFEPNVGVDVFFDTKDKALVVTNGKGEFHDVGIYAPRSARPGEHWITALERNNDKGAQQLFLIQTDWAQGRFDVSLTGTNPYENVLNKRTVGNLALHWTYPNGHRISGCPAVKGGVVYIGDVPNAGQNTSNLYALKADDGSLLWSYLADGFYYCPAVVENIVYVGGGTHLYALDADNGRLIWSYDTGNSIGASPTICRSLVIRRYGSSYSGRSLWLRK